MHVLAWEVTSLLLPSRRSAIPFSYSRIKSSDILNCLISFQVGIHDFFFHPANFFAIHHFASRSCLRICECILGSSVALQIIFQGMNPFAVMLVTIHCSASPSFCGCEFICRYTNDPLFRFAVFCRCEFLVWYYYADGFLLSTSTRFWWCEFVDDPFIGHSVALHSVSPSPVS